MVLRKRNNNQKEGDAKTVLNQRNPKYASMVHATDYNVIES